MIIILEDEGHEGIFDLDRDLRRNQENPEVICIEDPRGGTYVYLR